MPGSCTTGSIEMPTTSFTARVRRAAAPARAASLKHHIKSYVGVSADVKLGTIERSIGKAKRVIDKRPK